MDQLFKSALIVAVSLGASTSFAECNTDSKLKLVKFPPSHLAAYLPQESSIEKNIYNNFDSYMAKYNIIYQDKPITLIIESSHPLDLANLQGASYETVKLTNISDNAELKKWQCKDEICSYLLLRSGDITDPAYNITVSYVLPMHEVHIGEAFMQSLFIDNADDQSVEPDTTIHHGPFKIDIKFEPNSAIISPQYHSKVAEFAQFINDNKVNVSIAGNTDKTEVLIKSENIREYSFMLSKERAEAVRHLPIDAYGVDPAKIKETTAESY